jgi:DUF2884 family protein
MNAKRPSRAALLAATLLALVAGRASAVDITIHGSIDKGIDIRHDDIVITAHDDTKARITPDGALYVDGDRVKLTDAERVGFSNYNAALHLVKDQAVDVGLQGAGLAFSAIGEVISAIADGEPHRAEHRVEGRAERLKDEARKICDEIRTLERLQDTLARSVPEFEPYAVIQLDRGDCHVE